MMSFFGRNLLVENTIKALQSEGKRDKKPFGTETNYILHAGVNLLKQLSTLDSEQKNQYEIILAGTVILMMAREDAKYGALDWYGNKLLSPLPMSKILGANWHKELVESKNFEQYYMEKIKLVGSRVLIDKLAPFAGIQPHVFPTLSEVVPKNIFAKYQLIDDKKLEAASTQSSEQKPEAPKSPGLTRTG